MAREIVVKKITSGIPIDVGTIGVRELDDVTDSNLSAANAFLKYNDSNANFEFVDLNVVIQNAGLVSSVNGETGTIVIPEGVDSAGIQAIITTYLADETNLNTLSNNFDADDAQRIVDKATVLAEFPDSLDGGSF